MTRWRDVCCNGASPAGLEDPLELEYRPGAKRNVRVGLPRFVQDVYHIPSRTLDLLEIAAYVYAADRHTHRGSREAMEFQAWSRRFRIRMLVRDPHFWQRDDVAEALRSCLTFMTGDADYEFDFRGGHATPPTSLFDEEQFVATLGNQKRRVALFSGGLDSLMGALTALRATPEPLVLVSHQSQPGSVRTQRALVRAIHERFPGRVMHYPFECNLAGVRAEEETQRSRSFLYGAIGFAIAQAYNTGALEIYENGVTSLNLTRREDLANARASRTTHPKTLQRLNRLLALVSGEPFQIATPSFWLSKREVVLRIAELGHGDLIASSVSCSRTFQRKGDATHCGRCFQCFDRRLATFAAGLEKVDDAGLYSLDIMRHAFPDEESKTVAVDYLRQAASFANGTADEFHREYLSELADIVEDLPCPGSDLERVERVWQLMRTHGRNVREALLRIRELHDNPLSALPEGTLLELVSSRAHLRPAVLRLADKVSLIVEGAIGKLFRFEKPKDEMDLNSKLAALIGSHVDLVSEHPAVTFACARVIPDHAWAGTDLLIEAKYIRENTTPSKAAEGIAADLIKYPKEAHILFLVYDPFRRISDDKAFRRDFEAKGRCTVRILR